MKRMIWGLYAVMGLAALILLQLAVLHLSGALERDAGWYAVDAPTVAKLFLEERGNDLSEDELRSAILVFDQMVVAEAEAIYASTGARLVNKAHVLAGAPDVSEDFAARVIARWDEVQ